MQPSMSGAVLGGVFTDNVQGGRAGVHISLDAAGIHAVVLGEDSKPSRVVLTIKYTECSLERGGASGKMIFCRNADRSVTIFSEVPEFREFLEHGSAGGLVSQIAQLAASQRLATSRSLRLGAIVVGCLAVVVGLGYFGIRWGAKAALDAVPESVDVEIGKLVLEGSPPQGRTVDNPEVVQAIEMIVKRLEQPLEDRVGIDFDFDVRVVESPVVNAFALPGGKIVVFTGLIEKAERVEQVAGVIGHEMSHVARRHGIHSVIESLGILGVVELLLGDLSGLAGMAVGAIELGAISSYSRERESEADLDAVHILNAAGIDPEGLAEFFERMAEDNGDIPEILAWQSSHPAHQERIAAIHESIADLTPNKRTPLSIDWDNVRDHVKD